MIRAIVIDDESVARDTLYKCCQKYAPDFEIVKNFDNGTDALSYLQENDVDLVFTDIKMPGITGIDVAKWIYENKPYIKVVVVSGHSDFIYAKQAMEYGALYYLLKVIDIDSFKSLVSKITREYNQNLYNYKTVELKEFFFDVIYSSFENYEQMSKQYKDVCQLSENDAICRILAIDFKDLDTFLNEKWHYSRERFHNAIINIIQKTYHQCFAMLIGENKSVCKYLMLFPNNDSKQIDNSVIGEKINEIMGINVSINTEEMTIKDLYEIYNDNSTAFEKTDEIKEEDNNQKAKQILINQVKEYIENNYSKGILKNDVADYFNINKDYLGRIFKEGTDRSISEYMLEIRINKAKELVAQNYSHSQICQSVGYIDTRSFRRLFLKVTGMTLQEYKESL